MFVQCKSDKICLNLGLSKWINYTDKYILDDSDDLDLVKFVDYTNENHFNTVCQE